MTYSLAFFPQAEADILESIRWYNTEKAALEFDFYDQLQQTLGRISENPLHYSIRLKRVRASKVYQFPFLVYFKIYEDQKAITILAVLHTSRNPKEINKRK